MDDKVTVFGLCFTGSEDGGAKCSSFVGFSGGLRFPWQSDSEDGASGFEHIGMENGINHPFCISSSLRFENVPRAQYFNNPCILHSVKVIFRLIRVTSSMIYRPSAVAAAATLMAMDQGLTKNAMEDKLSSISSHQFLQIADVFECYCEMRRLEIEKGGMKSPDLRRTNLRSSSTASGSKRKRLQFDKREPSCNQ